RDIGRSPTRSARGRPARPAQIVLDRQAGRAVRSRARAARGTTRRRASRETPAGQKREYLNPCYKSLFTVAPVEERRNQLKKPRAKLTLNERRWGISRGETRLGNTSRPAGPWSCSTRTGLAKKDRTDCNALRSRIDAGRGGASGRRRPATEIPRQRICR